MEKITQKTFREYKNSMTCPQGISMRNDIPDAEEITRCLFVPKFFEENKDHEICVLSCDDIENGKVGYAIFTSDTIEDEKNMLIQKKVFNVDKTIVCETIESFEMAFNDAAANNYYMIKCDDPKRLRVGFIVLSGNETILYYVRLNEYKKYE